MTDAEPSTRASRPPVVLLHGFLGSGEDWRALRTGLSPTFRCICPDLPGHGDGGAPEGQGLEETSDDLVGHFDDWRNARGGLVGYSMGGRLALLMALRHPSRLACLVLESASPGLKTEEERQARMRHDRDLAMRLEQAVRTPAGFRDFLRAWYDQPLFASLHDHEGLVERLIESRRRSAALAEALRVFGTGAQPSLWEALSEHRIPTLLIVGERDRKYRFLAEEMAERCPAMAMEVFANCGHNVHLEHPDGYTTAVRSFLSANL